MSKSKELCTFIVPMVATGLLILWVVGLLPTSCLPRAAGMAAALLGMLLIATMVFDLIRSTRARPHSLVRRH